MSLTSIKLLFTMNYCVYEYHCIGFNLSKKLTKAWKWIATRISWWPPGRRVKAFYRSGVVVATWKPSHTGDPSHCCYNFNQNCAFCMLLTEPGVSIYSAPALCLWLIPVWEGKIQEWFSLWSKFLIKTSLSKNIISTPGKINIDKRHRPIISTYKSCHETRYNIQNADDFRLFAALGIPSISVASF